MVVSKNSGTPKSSILIGFSIINHPFWGTPIFGDTHMKIQLTRMNWLALYWCTHSVVEIVFVGIFVEVTDV